MAFAEYDNLDNPAPNLWNSLGDSPHTVGAYSIAGTGLLALSSIGGTRTVERIRDLLLSEYYGETQDDISTRSRGTALADWVEKHRRRAVQIPSESILQKFQKKQTLEEENLRQNTGQFNLLGSLSGLFLGSRLLGVLDHGDLWSRNIYFHFDIEQFRSSFRKVSYSHFASYLSLLHQPKTLGSGFSTRISLRQLVRKSLNLYAKEVTRLAAKKLYWIPVDLEAAELGIAQQQAHDDIQRSILGKAAARATAKQQSRLEPKQVNWVLTETAGKQIHKAYFKLSPHRSIYVPEARWLASEHVRNSTTSEIHVSNDKETFRWLTTILRRWASTSSPKNGLVLMN